MAAGDLTDIDTALAWLGLPNDDGIGTVAKLVTAISTQIQQFLSRTIAVASYSKAFNGRGGQMLMLPDYPLVSVSSVSVNGSAIPVRSGATPGYVFSEKTIYLDPPYRFTKGFQNVAVAYRAGYEQVPPDIERACLEWLKIANEAPAANVSMERAGDHEQRFEAQVTKFGRGTIPMPPTIFAMLQPYCRVAPA
jgi:hypothetical protein